MMFTRVAALALAVFPALAAATPVLESRGGGRSNPQCSTGELKCCKSVQSASSPAVQKEAGALGIALSSLTGMVGLQCNPITVIGVATGNTCKTQAACCSDNSHGSAISLGCVPVSS